MQKHFTTRATYFLQEGIENLDQCLAIAFQAAKEQKIGKIVVFTARGEGVRRALENFCPKPEYEHIRMIAVTFPAGKSFTDQHENSITVEISDENVRLFQSHDVPIIKAHLPFNPIAPVHGQQGSLGQDLSLVGEALNMFGGSMSLCVQAIVLACDAGAVGLGEHVIAITSDTAILAQATSTRRMLGELVIREILCKPAILTIGRREIAETTGEPIPNVEQKVLPEKETKKPTPD